MNFEGSGRGLIEVYPGVSLEEVRIVGVQAPNISPDQYHWITLFGSRIER
jgi:hypothetical protein